MNSREGFTILSVAATHLHIDRFCVGNNGRSNFYSRLETKYTTAFFVSEDLILEEHCAVLKVC